MIVYCTTNLNLKSINYGKKYIGRDKHNNPKYLGSGSEFKKDLKLCGKENFKKQILEYCNSFEEMIKAEVYWIVYFNAQKSDLFYNIAEGGERGYDIRFHPDRKDIILRQKETRKQTFKDNPSLLESYRERLKQTHKDPKIVRRRIETRKQTLLKDPGLMSRVGKQVYLNNPDKNAKLRKPLLCYDLNGKLIKKFISISEAVRELQLAPSGIIQCFQGKIKKCHNYMFTLYKGEIINQITPYTYPLKGKSKTKELITSLKNTWRLKKELSLINI